MSDSPVYFWMPAEEAGYLSQWFRCPFRDDQDPDKIYPTAEHYMMHHKALLFNDTAIAARCLTESEPGKVKSLGRQVSGFTQETWLAHREDIVVRGNWLKFTNAVTEDGFRVGEAPAKTRRGRPSSTTDRPAADGIAPFPLITETSQGSLQNLLLATGDRELVEASPHDRIWGVGFSAEEAGDNRHRWGQNLLGKALMEVRQRLREG